MLIDYLFSSLIFAFSDQQSHHHNTCITQRTTTTKTSTKQGRLKFSRFVNTEVRPPTKNDKKHSHYNIFRVIEL